MSMDSHYKALPKLVYQIDSTSCWAAVMESWVASIPGRKFKPTQDEMLASYPDKTFPDGSVIPAELEGEISSSYGMANEWIDRSSLTATYLAGKLASMGHLVIGYHRRGLGGHVVVCYGVGRPTGKDQMVSVMDPDTSAGYQNRPFSTFRPMTNNQKIFVGWPKQGLNPDYF